MCLLNMQLKIFTPHCRKRKEIFETLFIFWVLSLSVILQVIDAANEVVGSIDRDELAKYFSLKSDPEDEEAEVCFFVTTSS